MKSELLRISFFKEKDDYYVSLNGDKPTLFRPPTPDTENYFRKDLSFFSLSSMRHMGYWLFLGVFQDERRKYIQKLESENRAGIIQIRSDDLFIQRLPWEILSSSDKEEEPFLLQTPQFSLVRSLEQRSLRPSRMLKRPLRLLVILSLPVPVYEEAPVSVLEEWDTIYRALEPLIQEGELQVDVEEEANRSTIARHLSSGDAYDMIHFVGHGQRGGHLLLENDRHPEAEPQLLDLKEFITLFKGRGLFSVFLNACETATSLKSLPDLLFTSQQNCQIPISCGYQGPVSDRAALNIAGSFYPRLLNSRNPAEMLLAFNEVRRHFPTTDPSWWKMVLWVPENLENLPVPEGKSKSIAVPALVEKPRPVVPDFVYRYRQLREIGRYLRQPGIKAILLHGIGGSGKTQMASYAGSFYSFLFRAVLVETCSQVSSPRNILESLQKKISSLSRSKGGTSRKKTGISPEGVLSGEQILIVLEDLESVLDREGHPASPEWEEFLEFLMRGNWPGKALLLSRSLMRLRDWKPGEREGSLTVVDLGGFSPGEMGVYFKKQPGLEDLLTGEFRDVLEHLAGNHPFSLNAAMQTIRKAGWEDFRDDPQEFEEMVEARVIDEPLKNLSPDEKTHFLRLAVVPGAFPQAYIRHACPKKPLRDLIDRRAWVERWRVNNHVLARMHRPLARYLTRGFSPEGLRDVRIFAASFFTVRGEKKQSLQDHLLAFQLLLSAGEAKEAEDLLRRMFPALQQVLPPQAIEPMVHGLLSRGELEPESRSCWAFNLGILAQLRGNYEKAETFYRESLKIEQEIGDQAGVSMSLHNLGILAQDRGNYEEAETFYRESLKIKQKIGDQAGVSISLHQSGMLAQLRGNYEEAETFYKESLKILQKIGDQAGVSGSLHQLGMLAQLRGNYEEAETFYRESLNIKQKIGDQAGVSKSLHELGILAQLQGNYEEAETFYKESLKIDQKIGDQAGVSISLHQLGTLAQDRGNYEEAETFYKESLNIKQKIGDQAGVSISLHQLGILAQLQGNYEEAETFYKESLKIDQKIGDQAGASKSLHQLGILEQNWGNHQKAMEYLLKTFEILSAIGSADIITNVQSLMRLRTELGEKEFRELGNKVHYAAFQSFCELTQRLKSP